MEVGWRKKELGEEKVIHKANSLWHRSPRESGRAGCVEGRAPGEGSASEATKAWMPVIRLKTLMTVFGKLFGDKKVFFSQNQIKIR